MAALIEGNHYRDRTAPEKRIVKYLEAARGKVVFPKGDRTLVVMWPTNRWEPTPEYDEEVTYLVERRKPQKPL